MSDDLRAALLALKAPEQADGAVELELAQALGHALRNYRMSQQALSGDNSGDGVPGLSVDMEVDAAALVAAAEAGKRHHAQIEAAARTNLENIRSALAAFLAAEQLKRAEGTSHDAFPTEGKLRARVDPAAVPSLPPQYKRVKEEPNLAALRDAHSKGIPLPEGARVEHGPPGVTVKLRGAHNPNRRTNGK